MASVGPGSHVRMRDEEPEAVLAIFGNRKQRDGAVADGHLDGEAAADFAVIDVERTDPGLAFRDRDVARAVMSHQDDVVVQIDRIVLGERAAGVERVHDLHRDSVLDLVLAGDGNVPRGEQRGAEDDGTHRVFVGGDAGSLVVVGERGEIVLLRQAVKRDGSAGGALQFGERAVGLDVEVLAKSRTRWAICSAVTLSRNALSSSTSSISMWQPKVIETCVMSVATSSMPP